MRSWSWQMPKETENPYIASVERNRRTVADVARLTRYPQKRVRVL
jgi:hypothetical protein